MDIVVPILILILVGLAVSFAVSFANKGQKDKVPMRPYLEVDGQLREIVHRRRTGDMVVCTIKPLQKGLCRPRIVVPLNSDSIRWLPKGS